MAQTWPLRRSRGCPWHIFENVEDHFNYYLLFVVIINIETLNKINIRNPNLTSLLCLVLYKLNCQHLLHSYKTNSTQSKTLTLQDSLFLNGRGHLFSDLLMSRIYYHHASVLRFQWITNYNFFCKISLPPETTEKLEVLRRSLVKWSVSSNKNLVAGSQSVIHSIRSIS